IKRIVNLTNKKICQTGLIFIGRIRNPASGMHAPSRFSFDRSENLFPHGAWDMEVPQVKIGHPSEKCNRKRAGN
uniref:hypothetical protein n=1 Tax=Dialister sp. TaxID=1955814 RepID=UPI004024AC0F